MSINRLEKTLNKAKRDVEIDSDSIILALPDNGRGDSDWEVEGENNYLIYTRHGNEENKITVKYQDTSHDEILTVAWSENGSPAPGQRIKNPYLFLS